MHRRVDESDCNDVSLYEVGDEIFDVRLKRLAGPAEIIGVELYLDLSLAEGEEKHVCGLGGRPLSGYGQNEQDQGEQGDNTGKSFLHNPKVWSSQSGLVKKKNSRGNTFAALQGSLTPRPHSIILLVNLKTFARIMVQEYIRKFGPMEER